MPVVSGEGILDGFLEVIFLHLGSAIRTRWGVVVQFSDDFLEGISINNIHNLDIRVFNIE